jgi:hypothetical protein
VGPATVAHQPTAADDGGSVSEAAKPTTTLLCHYDATTGTSSDLKVPPAAVQGHLNHGDVLGSCAVCPCFTAADLALSCSDGETLGATCTGEEPYYLLLGCNAGTTFGFSVSVRVDVDAASCWVVKPGPFFQQQAGLTPAQLAVCKSLIVSSPHYPASCPK